MPGRIIVPKVREARVRQEGPRVIIEGDVRDLPWHDAERLARAIFTQARRAEEHEKANAIALDAAILLRAGATIGLTDHPKIRAEAAKEAVTNRDLRRYMPTFKGTKLYGQAKLITKGQGR